MTAPSDTVTYNSTVVTIFVADMNAAVRFYTNTLGFALASRYGDEFAMVKGPGVTLGLHPNPSTGGKRGGVSLGLSVDSLERAMQGLSARGLEFAGGIVEDAPMRFAYFHDPDGVDWYLAQENAWR
ncbi:MAG TPA: VOC family protein [Candidatus Eremiobacteraceae bacterium]|nr:VOC family protein [Candidatus Eremiobacteraceae bacterium]